MMLPPRKITRWRGNNPRSTTASHWWGSLPASLAGAVPLYPDQRADGSWDFTETGTGVLTQTVNGIGINGSGTHRQMFRLLNGETVIV